MALVPDSVTGNARYGGQFAAPNVKTPVTPPVTPAAPPAPAPFNYGDLLKNDPILGQALAGINASGVQNQAGLNAAQQRALIQYGSVPSVSLPGVNQIDATTRQLAAENTQAGTSTTASLQKAYQQAQQGSDASLAARGLLRSGAYGQHAAENLQGYNQGQYQATNALTDYLQGIYSGYLQQQQTLQQSGVGATNDALNRIIQLIQAGYYTGGTAAPPPPTAPPPPVTAPASSGYLSPAFQKALADAAVQLGHPVTPTDQGNATVLTLPSSASAPVTVPLGTIPQPGKRYAL